MRMRTLTSSFVLLSSSLVTASSLQAQTTLAPTPPMGWNSWNHFACRVTAAHTANGPCQCSGSRERWGRRGEKEEA